MSDDLRVPQGKILYKNKFQEFFTNLYAQARGKRYFDSKREHLILTVTHSLNCVLIYLAFGRSDISFLAAILFALNPANNQAAVWLSGWAYSMAATCVLLMVLFKPLSFIFYFTSIQFFTLSGILSPLLFIKFPEYWFWIFLLPLVVLVKRSHTLEAIKIRSQTASPRMREIHLKKLILVIKTFAYYFVFCLFPIKIGLYHTFMYTYGLTKEDSDTWLKLDRQFWLSLVLCVVYLITLIVNWSNGIGFGLFWYALFIGMWCNLITIQQAIAERYVYLANIGLMYAVAWGLCVI